MQITCLDDDPRMESILRRLLTRLGHRLRFESSVMTFKASLAQRPPDLILLDLGLGRESGIDIIHWLAENGFAIPVVLISGHGDSVLDTARRVAQGRDLPTLGVVNKARISTELPALLKRLRSAPALANAPPTQQPSPEHARHTEHTEPATLPTADDRLDVEQLQSLIASNAIQPYLQPIVAPADGMLRGAEVLARLRLPDGRILGAGDFIPLAESEGLLYPLTESLFRTLIDQKAQLARLSLGFLAVNLSPVCLHDQHIVDLVRSLVTGLGDICAIRAEVTETAASQSPQMVQSLAARIKLAGATLALDDFGTGYSSMRALAELPFETLKIDLSFVSEMFDSPKSLNLLRAIIGFAQRLKMQLVAEGVETEAQRQVLIAEGVDLAQGFLFGGAIPIDAFVERFSRGSANTKPRSLSDAL